MRRALPLALALGLVLACAWREPPPPATALAWRDCGGGFQCAELPVPIDHRDAGGAKLPLAITRLPADRPAERLGVLFVNPGGPGVSAIAYLQSAWPRLGETLHARFDLVAFDTRGTGRSRPLDCHQSLAAFLDQDPAAGGDAAWRSALAASRAFAAECAAKHGDLLPFMTTADSASDMDWVRAALGEERISYLGFSYGTALGATYLTLHPERVRALVLDGAIDPAFDLARFAREQAVAVEDALVAYDALARARGWSGEDALDLAYARAPHKTTVLYAAAEGLSSPPDGWRDLADALARAERGDPGGIDALAARYFGQRPDGTRELAVEAQLATLCADQHRLASADAYRAALPELAAASPHFGPANLLSHLPCAFWPEPARALPAPGTSGGPPILVLANDFDPLTPHRWGEALAARFPGATRVDVASRAHTAFGRGSACVDALVSSYFVAPAAPARTRCP